MFPNYFRIKENSTGVRLQIWIRDSSVGYPKGKTGLVYNTASLVAYCIADGQTAATAITLATATVGTYTAGGFKEVSSTNMPGLYEFGLPAGVTLSGADRATVMFKGAAGMADTPVYIQILPYTEEDIYNRTDEAYLAASTVNRLEDALRRLTVALGSKKRD